MGKNENLVRSEFPAILRRYRNQAGLSQQELADSIEVSKGFISALEGGRSVPNLARLLEIADALRVSPGKMVDSLAEAVEKLGG